MLVILSVSENDHILQLERIYKRDRERKEQKRLEELEAAAAAAVSVGEVGIGTEATIDYYESKEGEEHADGKVNIQEFLASFTASTLEASIADDEEQEEKLPPQPSLATDSLAAASHLEFHESDLLDFQDDIVSNVFVSVNKILVAYVMFTLIL
jgi:hypothetical protein